MTNMDIKNEKALNKVLSIFSSDELKKRHKNESIKKKLAPTPLYVHLLGYFSHIFLVLVGYLREAYYGPGPIGGSKKHSHEMGRVGYGTSGSRCRVALPKTSDRRWRASPRMLIKR